MTSRRKRRARAVSTDVHPTVDDQKILVEVATRVERGESIESILPDVPEHLRPAIEASFRSQAAAGQSKPSQIEDIIKCTI